MEGVFVESVEVTDTSANAPHAEQTAHAIRWFSAGKDAYCDSLLFPGGEAWRWSQRGAGTATFCCCVSLSSRSVNTDQCQEPTMPPSGIDPAAFPCLEADLDRVRDALGPVRIQGRPELDALTQEGPGTSRGLVRPTLALLSYYVLTDPSVPADDRAVLAAAAVEMLHLGALYHDDVVDHAHERRGRPSANAVWGDHLAILAGDCVMLTGLNMLAQLGQREVVEGTMANERMCAGMVMEAADLYAVSRSEQAYLDAIGGKTAHLFALACRLGAMQADRDGGRQESREEALAGFGWQFGYAYQLRDDILDLTSTVEELGKPVNTDLSEGVYTLSVIRAVSRDRDLGRLLGKEMTQEEAARARDLVVASGAVQEAQAVADAYMTEAADRLSHLTDHSCALDGLTAYARAVLDRPTASRPAVIPHQVRQAPQPQNSAHAEQVTRRLKGWLVETGIAATPAEADHHRLSGALSMIERIIPRVADQAATPTAMTMTSSKGSRPAQRWACCSVCGTTCSRIHS